MSAQVTVATRVPEPVRETLDRVVADRATAGARNPRGGPFDLSTAFREAIDQWLERHTGDRVPALPGQITVEQAIDEETHTRTGGRLLDDQGPAGAMRSKPTPTEHAAALAQAARAGTARRLALEAFEVAGDRGLTADEVVVKLAPRPHNGTARRVTDLLQGGLIEPLLLRHRPHAPHAEAAGDTPVHRRTRAGADAQVYRITGAGLLALRDKRREEEARR